MALSTELCEILVCPRCKGSVILTEDETGFACEACQLIYPVRDGIPVMLVDEADTIGDRGTGKSDGR